MPGIEGNVGEKIEGRLLVEVNRRCGVHFRCYARSHGQGCCWLGYVNVGD